MYARVNKTILTHLSFEFHLMMKEILQFCQSLVKDKELQVIISRELIKNNISRNLAIDSQSHNKIVL